MASLLLYWPVVEVVVIFHDFFPFRPVLALPRKYPRPPREASSTETLSSIFEELTSITKEVMTVSEEVLCAIASGNVPSTEEEVSKGDQDKLMVEESVSIIQEIILVDSDPYTSNLEATIINEVLGKTNKDVQTVQEEIVRIDVQKKVKKQKVIKHHKVIKPTNNNEINNDSDSDDGIYVILPSMKEQRKIAKAVLFVTDLRANKEWQNVAQVINENVHTIHEELFKANKEMLPI